MNKKTLITVSIGVLIGLVFSSQLRQLPVVNKIPTF